MKQKAQLSIFIVIAIIILFLISFLTYFSFSDQIEEIANEANIIDTSTAELFPIKTHIDSCIEKQVRRAAIISGLRGGFIYNDGEYYGPSFIPDDTYSSDFISNQDLNWNNLLFMALIHGQTQVYVPQLTERLVFLESTGEVVIYNKSIQSDMERFVEDQLLECIDLRELEEEGFGIEFELYTGSVLTFDQSSGLISIEEISGQQGDTVELLVDGQEIYGQILSQSVNLTYVQFNPEDLSGVPFDEELGEIKVANINVSVEVNISFSDDEIEAEVLFPISIDDVSGVTSFQKSVISIPIRFKQVAELASILVNEKYKDKALNYDNEEDVISVINKYYSTRDDFLNSLRFVKTIVNDSEIRKQYIYSIVDEGSLILGNPFVYNFGYENDAPLINLTSIGTEDLFGEGVLVLTSKDTPISLDLKPLTSDNQIRDNFVSNFNPQSYDGPDATFSLNSNGILFFEGYQEKRFSFDITVTDGEAVRTEPFVFITGLPDNEDNVLAPECFTIRSAEVPSVFPVAEEFKDVQSFTTSSDYEETYAYVLYLPNDLANEHGIAGSILNFRTSCLYSKELYTASVRIDGVGAAAYNSNTGDIFVPFSPTPQVVEVSVRSKSTGALATEPYVITLYPASCLGPHAETDSFEIALYGGDRSCCNTDPILASIAVDSPQAFVSSSTLETTGVAIQTDAYFCYDLFMISKTASLGSFIPAYESQIIWDTIGPDATSLYRGNIKAVCDGSSATGTLVDVTGGSDFVGTTTEVGYFGTKTDSQIGFSLQEVNNAGMCEFCNLENHAEFELYLGNSYVLLSGLVSQNPGALATVSPLPFYIGTESYSNVYVMCNDAWFGSSTGAYDPGAWNLGYNGAGDLQERIHISKGYCYQNSVACSGRVGSPTYKSRTDNSPRCYNWYADMSNGLFDFFPNTGWVCGVNETCAAGVCIEDPVATNSS